MVIPNPKHAQELIAHRKKEVKAKWVLLDFVKDHLILHIFENNTTKEMYEDLVVLYQSINSNWKLILGHQLRFVEMSSVDTIDSYLMRIT
jgi:hypothetical protein